MYEIKLNGVENIDLPEWLKLNHSNMSREKTKRAYRFIIGQGTQRKAKLTTTFRLKLKKRRETVGSGRKNWKIFQKP